MQQRAASLTALFGIPFTLAPVKPALDTRSYRCWNKLHVKTVICLGTERRQLKICTNKSDRSGIVTRASVSQVSEDGRSFIHMLFGDFSVVVLDNKTARGTEKAITAQHALALLQVDDLLAKVAAFYAPKAGSAA